MQLRLKDSLPFVIPKVGHKGEIVKISDVLVDTGSASTILAADSLVHIGIEPSHEDILHTIRGVGGVEVVYLRKVDFWRQVKVKSLILRLKLGEWITDLRSTAF